jgi:hypothetical protein
LTIVRATLVAQAELVLGKTRPIIDPAGFFASHTDSLRTTWDNAVPSDYRFSYLATLVANTEEKAHEQ